MERKTLRRTIGAAVAVGVIAIAIVVGVVSLRDRDPASPATLPPAPQAPQEAVVAVKIDNVAAARPQTGLGAAGIVYVEPVEGGLTRLLAVYAGELPEVVGPVRSARLTDVELLAQFGRPTLAYSGASRKVLPSLRGAQLVNASPGENPGAYFREPSRRAPHNLFLRTAELPEPAAAPANAPVVVGPAPAGGASTTQHRVAFRAASFDFSWSPEDKRWLITMDGEPVTSTEAGRLSAATVVEQRVEVELGRSPADASGNPSPLARTVGSGEATILRDGMRFTGRWTRPTPDEPTRFETADGEPLPLAAGAIWVLLVPSA